jgi:hypothetical protein
MRNRQKKRNKRDAMQFAMGKDLIKYAIVVIAILCLASCTSANVCRGYTKNSDANQSIFKPR